MKVQITKVEQVEMFTEAELESLEFTPEELEAIAQERVPDLDSISFEDIAEDLEALLETNNSPPINALSRAMTDPAYTRRQNEILRLRNRLGSDNIFFRSDRYQAYLRNRILNLYNQNAAATAHLQPQRAQSLPLPPPPPPQQQLRRTQSLPSSTSTPSRQATPPQQLRRQPAMQNLPKSALPPPPRPSAPGPQSPQNQPRGLGSNSGGGASA